ADIGLVLFDAGRIRQNIKIQTAAQARALASYESTVRLALEEIENSLVAFSQEQLRRQSLAKATAAAELASGLIRSQYTSGLVDFQRVLSAERSVLNLQDQLASSDGQITANLIRLYKAVGGGWKTLSTDEETTIMTEVKP
ncbi:MAG: TolC family protein, partial [Immundisolibacteraceae bacterium]|nr:TolC family protein [Immundisolibacteraceae bacterium]